MPDQLALEDIKNKKERDQLQWSMKDHKKTGKDTDMEED